MKRSEINHLMGDAVEFFGGYWFALPPWAFYSPQRWREVLFDPAQAGAHAEIIENALGWDLTDFGSGDFRSTGLLLFTLRNGRPGQPGGKTYAEKVLVVKERQVTPLHFHWSKMEDIIVRGGGNLQVKLFNASARTPAGSPPPPPDEAGDVTVSVDGIVRTVKAGSVVTLRPGQSICLPPYLYHEFWGEPRKGPVLVGEVSTVNDDARDNCFLKAPGRFPAIEEDEEPLYLLCNEYRKALTLGS